MTTTLATETTTFTVSSVFRAVLAGFRTLNARRAQRLALRTLIEMDAGRLDDLGINVQDVYEAINAPRAGATLEARRNTRALTWTPKTVPAA